MFGEFLSASLSSPFLYLSALHSFVAFATRSLIAPLTARSSVCSMIEDFGVGQGPGGGGEATVGFWTGVVS